MAIKYQDCCWFLFMLLALLAVNQNLSATDDNFSGGVLHISSLMQSTVDQEKDGVKFFAKLERGNINQQNLGGATALHLAARNSDNEIAKILIENGANVNVVDNEGWTPLMRAALNKNSDLILILISKDADATLINSVNESAILLAASANCTECVANLLKADYSKMDQETLKDQLKQAYFIAKNNNNEQIKALLAEYITKLPNLQNTAQTLNQAPIATKPTSPASQDVTMVISSSQIIVRELETSKASSPKPKTVKYILNGETPEVKIKKSNSSGTPKANYILSDKASFNSSNNLTRKKYVLVNKEKTSEYSYPQVQNKFLIQVESQKKAPQKKKVVTYNFKASPLGPNSSPLSTTLSQDKTLGSAPLKTTNTTPSSSNKHYNLKISHSGS